ncbi:MAG: hypothetical protein ABII64_01925 [Elusimicrobiota bacterium]
MAQYVTAEDKGIRGFLVGSDEPFNEQEPILSTTGQYRVEGGEDYERQRYNSEPPLTQVQIGLSREYPIDYYHTYYKVCVDTTVELPYRDMPYKPEVLSTEDELRSRYEESIEVNDVQKL